MRSLCLALCCLSHLISGEDRELIAVDLLYRHGDRTPITTYPNDPYKDPSQWPVGWGQLTSTGKMRHFMLGQYLRKRYGDLLPNDYSEKDIRVRSTDIDRTLMSAMSNLAGLYPPTKRWNENLNWQPIPVHTVKLSEDYLLSDHVVCPKLSKLKNELMASDDFKKINKEYEWVFNYASNHSGGNIDNVRMAGYLRDTLSIEETYNKTLPDWTKKVYPQPLGKIQLIAFKVATWTTEMKRLSSGPFIKTLVERMEGIAEEVRQNTSLSTYKMIMYSGHDTTIASLLNSLNFDQPSVPPYASCIMMELFRNKDGDEFDLRLLYRNQTDHEPFVLNYEGCGEYCPLGEFRKRAEKLMPGDWKAECFPGSEESWDSFLAVVSVTVTGLLLVILIISVIVSFFRRRRTTIYSPIVGEVGGRND